MKFRSFVKVFVAPVFRFEITEKSWYRKSDFVDLTFHAAMMNSYAEGLTPLPIIAF